MKCVVAAKVDTARDFILGTRAYAPPDFFFAVVRHFARVSACVRVYPRGQRACVSARVSAHIYVRVFERARPGIDACLMHA